MYEYINTEDGKQAIVNELQREIMAAAEFNDKLTILEKFISQYTEIYTNYILPSLPSTSSR